MASSPLKPIRERAAALRLAFTNTRKVDPRLVPMLVGAALLAFGACVVVGLLTDTLVAGAILGVLLAALAALVVLGQRTSAAAIGTIRGRPGAAAAVLQSMRGKWRVTPAVAVTRKQDFVHRVVGRPGVILVGEGAPARVSTLLRQEARRVARVAGDAPVLEVSVGDGDNQVPLNKLQSHLTRLPRKLKPGAVDALAKRLSSLGETHMPIPKGPMPRGPRR